MNLSTLDYTQPKLLGPSIQAKREICTSIKRLEGIHIDISFSLKAYINHLQLPSYYNRCAV